jgi:phage-related protein
MAVFTFTPSFPATEASKPRVRKTQFGDGYEQRVAFGLNTNPKEWSLTFAERTDAERDAIETFFDARGGTESFDWTAPGGAAGKFVCEEWQNTLNSCNRNTLTATFRQVFEP